MDGLKGKARYDKIFKSAGTAKTQSSASNRISNLKTRLSSGGVNVEKETDTRNAFEKLVNLPEGQNFF